MTIAQALAFAARQGLARLDAQLILLHALGRDGADRAWLIAHDADELEDNTRACFTRLCERRRDGEPVAYLVGHREFAGLRLGVDARVLDPRPDTETLVDWALDLLPDAPMRAIDLGTGSGAIALALKARRPAWHVEAVDASDAALDVATANARALSLDVHFRRADWLAGASGYDLIVSNPPYVAQDDPHLGALRHEPRSALAAGVDGLDDLRRITAQAPAHLATGGWLLLEHGFDQAPAVRDLLAAAGFRDIATRRDLAGIERCSGGRRLELG